MNEAMVIKDEIHQKEHRELFAKVVFPFMCLAAGLLMDAIARIMGQPILSTVALMVLGFFIPESGYFLLDTITETVDNYVDEYTWASLKSHEIMLILLPILIFESAFSIEAHEFLKHFFEIIILAGPCFIVGFVLLAGWMYVLVTLLRLPFWSFSVCLLYSAVISATDPVAVVMLLSKLGVPHRLRLLIEGESLLNDGVAIVLYSIFNMVVLKELEKTDVNIMVQVVYKILLVGLSIICGMIFGRVTGWLLGRLRDPLREHAVILLFVYGTYCICEATQGSGVLGVVTYALVLNSQKEALSAKSARVNTHMWQFWAYWANWILFILTGLMACQNLQKSSQSRSDIYTFKRLLGLGCWAYVGAFICRFISLAIYTLLTAFTGKKHPHWRLPWSYTMMLTWGGLRGSIALLLAMQMGDNPKLDDVSPAALGCVSFTVLISNVYHTLSSKFAADRLNLTQISNVKTHRIEALTESLNKHVRTIRSSYPTMHAHFWSEAVWDKVEELCSFVVSGEEESDTSTKKDKPEETVETARDQEEEETVNRLIIMDVICAYARTLGEREVISTLSVRYVVNAINEAIDRHGALDMNLLYYQLQPYDWLRRVSSTLKSLLDKFENCCSLKVKQCFIGTEYKQSSDRWQLFWHILVFGHCFLILHAHLSFNTLSGYAYDASKYQYILYFLCVFPIILFFEIAIRFWMVRGEIISYMCNRVFWRVYDVIRAIIYIFAAIVIGVILKSCFEFTRTYEVESNDTISAQECNLSLPKLSHIPFLQLSSLAPLIALIAFPFWLLYMLPRVCILELHDYIVKADNLTLETMHGLLLIAEHVLQSLESDNGIVLDSEEMRRKFEGENLVMKQEAETKLIALLNIESDSAHRMMYIKTRQVVRMILSEGMAVLEQKLKGGEINKYEYNELEKKMKERMRLSQQFFSRLKPPTFEMRLKLVPWIMSSKKKRNLVEFIKQNSKETKFKKGESLLKQGDEANGAYFLMNGICRFSKTDGKETKILHLLYPGQFIGEKSFLISKSVGSVVTASLPKRSGNVYAETNCTAYFLTSHHAMNLLKMDPNIARKFEENDAAYTCRDAIRRRLAFTTWTAPALEKFIRNNWQIYDREEILPDLKDGAVLICIKGEIEVEKGKRIMVNPPHNPVKIFEGPHSGITIFGTEQKRCFVLELNEMVQHDSDSDIASSSYRASSQHSALEPGVWSISAKSSKSAVQK